MHFNLLQEIVLLKHSNDGIYQKKIIRNEIKHQKYTILCYIIGMYRCMF